MLTGADVIRVRTIEEFRTALDQARAATRLTAVQARKVYEAHKAEQRDFLAPVTKDFQR